MKKSNLMSGAVVLSIGSVLAKIFSAVYRIGLTRILGGVGIGIYQLIFPFYSLCVVFATAGLPMAISKVISKNKDNEAGVVKKCLKFTSIISLIITFILLVSSKGLSILQGQRQISIFYIILAPTIIVVSVASVLRGYFQGKHNFIPSAVSNIIEQFIKLSVGLILSLSLISISLFAGVLGAVIGLVVSEILSLVVLMIYIKQEKLKVNSKVKISIKEISKDIFPITLTNIILPIATFIDSIVVINILSINFSNELSVFLYGLESGAVSSLVSLPTIFSFAIASVILPNLTSVNNKLNKNFKFTLAIKIVLILTIPCVVGFVLVPNRLIEFLYHSKLNAYGINAVEIASSLLSVSGIGIVFLAVNQIYSSSLQAEDERFATIRNLSIAVISKFVIELIFMPSKLLNIYVLAISNTLCYVLVMVLNHFEIKRKFDLKIDYMFWAKLIFSNCIMILSLVSILSISNSKANLLLGVILAIVVYFVCLNETQIFTKKDKAMLKYKV